MSLYGRPVEIPVDTLYSSREIITHI